MAVLWEVLRVTGLLWVGGFIVPKVTAMLPTPDSGDAFGVDDVINLAGTAAVIVYGNRMIKRFTRGG